MFKSLAILLLWMSLMIPAKAQTTADAIKDVVSSIDTFSTRFTPEKLYLHLDKPYYSIGDTIWFKAYLFDASFLTPSKKSGIFYVEIANDTNKVLLRRMVNVYSGLGSGSIAMPKDVIPEGSYTIRAYTNLMRNFGEERVFKKTFYVTGLSGQDWLAGLNTMLADSAGKTNLRLGLKLTRLNNQVVGLKDLGIRVMDGKRVILRDKTHTDSQGNLDVNFNLPERHGKLSLIAEDQEKGKEQQITIPIIPNKPENTDLQFMPEGGSFVAGVASKIGFKAIGDDGKGVEVSGKVLNSANEPVAEFKSLHRGMLILPESSDKRKIYGCDQSARQ